VTARPERWTCVHAQDLGLRQSSGALTQGWGGQKTGAYHRLRVIGGKAVEDYRSPRRFATTDVAGCAVALVSQVPGPGLLPPA
jgi:hypothetical protein